MEFKYRLQAIREPSVVLIPCCTKTLSKVDLRTQNSQANSEQAN